MSKLQGQNKPRRIFTNFKLGKISLIGYKRIISGAKYASQDIHKLQAGQNKPHRIYTNYKWGKICLTGYKQNTSVTYPVYYIVTTDYYVTQDLHRLSYLTG